MEAGIKNYDKSNEWSDIMKKHIILGICGLIIAILSGCNYMQIREGEDDMSVQDAKFEEDGEINFQLLGSYEVDTSGIRNNYHNIAEDDPFTFFWQERNLERLQEFADVYNVTLPDFGIDFDNYRDNYLVITFGRKLAGLRLIDQWHGHLFAEIIFAEEYQGQIMYLYIMDNILLYPPDMGRHAFYIMRGSERVYYGHTVGFVMTAP